MGMCKSKNNVISRGIDKQIANDNVQNKRIQKLLILGAGESGKSTVLKQIRLLHCQGFSVEERVARKGAIYSNITTSIATIVAAMEELNIKFDNPNLQAEGNLVVGLLKENKTMESLTEELVIAIKHLWADAGVQLCYERRAEYQLADCAQFFIESIDRIAVDRYTPTDQDMLYSRVATSGAVHTDFTASKTQFRVFDVGGQRSRRKKWIHFFDDVKAVLFVAAISEYNQTLREDNQTNRLAEAVAVFEPVAKSVYFANSAMILFLNKIDLFREKIEDKKIPLTVCFPDFRGDQCSYSAAVKYIEKQFLARRASIEQRMYVHETCATNTNQVQVVVSAVINVVVHMALKNSGME